MRKMALAVTAIVCGASVFDAGVLGGGVWSAGSEARAAEVAQATHFTCTFEQGHSWSFANGSFANAPPSKLSFDIAKIDLEGQAAELIAEGKPGGKLRIVRALNANHFLEVANEGFLNLTTVYDLDATPDVHPAVHSRHFGLLGQPMFAQYAGICRPKAP